MAAIPPPPRLFVTPERDMIDNEVSITITCMLPRQPVTLYAFLKSQKTDTWESWGHYVADDEGQVNVSTDRSIGGTYCGIEPMGLFWSMQSTPDQMKGNRLRHYDVMKPRIVDIYVYIGHINHKFDKDKAVAMATIERWYIKPGVKRIPITEGSVRGTLFLPPGPGPFPLILDLWGGGGGIIEYKSSLLASHGFAAAVLAYSNHPELPPMGRTDMEYFEEAYKCLCRYSQIDTDNIGIIGISMGVSVALEIAAESKLKVKCAILTNGGLVRSYILLIGIAKATGMLPPSMSIDIPRDEDGHISTGCLSHCEYLRNEYGEDGFVKVENLNCPCLFLICGDDPSFENEQHLQEIYNKLSAVGKQDLVEVLRYPKAGHLLEPPYSPLCSMTYLHVEQLLASESSSHQTVYLNYGGQPKPHAEAQEHSWKAILQYFHKHLRCEKTKIGNIGSRL